jgi:hypothetical protein
MSTNFYLIPAGVTSVDDPTAVHVGKISAGGKTLRAHRESPFGAIESWSDWRRALATEGWALMDEYGDQLHVANFVLEVESGLPAGRYAHLRRTEDAISAAAGKRCRIGGPSSAWTHEDDSLQNVWADDQGYLMRGTDFC